MAQLDSKLPKYLRKAIKQNVLTKSEAWLIDGLDETSYQANRPIQFPEHLQEAVSNLELLYATTPPLAM